MRKPSFTVFCLDFWAVVTVVIPFDDRVIDRWRTDGIDPAALRGLLARVTAEGTGGGTNIYDPVIAGLDAMEGINLEDYSPTIILMTDGRANAGRLDDLETRLGQPPGTVPIYAILFGDASTAELTAITEATSGRIFDIFDGQSDLIGAFREAKGYN